MTRHPVLDNDWIMQSRPPARPTEILVPVKVQIAPVSYYDGQGDGWQADVFAELLGEYAGIDCGHCHPTQNEAWACGDMLARSVARDVIGARWDQGQEEGK